MRSLSATDPFAGYVRMVVPLRPGCPHCGKPGRKCSRCPYRAFSSEAARWARTTMEAHWKRWARLNGAAASREAREALGTWDRAVRRGIMAALKAGTWCTWAPPAPPVAFTAAAPIVARDGCKECHGTGGTARRIGATGGTLIRVPCQTCNPELALAA